MSDSLHCSDVRPLSHAAHCNAVADKMLAGLLLYALLRAGAALAGEQGAATHGGTKPDLPNYNPFADASPALGLSSAAWGSSAPALGSSWGVLNGSAPRIGSGAGRSNGAASPTAGIFATSTPGNFTAPAFSEHEVFSTTDFRPRKHTLFDHEAAPESIGDAPMLHGTTVWQRLSDYRSRDRVRLLTLWESGASTVSLQAGKRGDPSLQWTSRLMNRGGSTRGLLDQLFSVSLVGAGNAMRGGARSQNAQFAAKQQVNPGPVVNGK
jgi:hypothetical protein